MKKSVIAVDRVHISSNYVSCVVHTSILYMCALYYLTKCMYMDDLATIFYMYVCMCEVLS